MTVPLPNWRSIWVRAPWRAVSRAFAGLLDAHGPHAMAGAGQKTYTPLCTELRRDRCARETRVGASASVGARRRPVRGECDRGRRGHRPGGRGRRGRQRELDPAPAEPARDATARGAACIVPVGGLPPVTRQLPAAAGGCASVLPRLPLTSTPAPPGSGAARSLRKPCSAQLPPRRPPPAAVRTPACRRSATSSIVAASARRVRPTFTRLPADPGQRGERAAGHCGSPRTPVGHALAGRGDVAAGDEAHDGAYRRSRSGRRR